MNTDIENVKQAKESFNSILGSKKYAGIIKDNKGIIDNFMRIKKDGHIQFYSSNELDELFISNGFTKENQAITEMKFPFAKQIEYTNLYDQITDKEKTLYDITNDNGVIWIKHINVGNTIFVKQ